MVDKTSEMAVARWRGVNLARRSTVGLYSSVHQVIGHETNPNPLRALRGASTSVGLGLVCVQ